MASLDELTRIDGVILACEFTPDGKCEDYRANMEIPREMANKATQYIATVSMLFNTLANAFTKESQMNWVPQQGWTYTGGDWTVVVSGNRAVFVEKNKADIDSISRTMADVGVEERIQPSM